METNLAKIVETSEFLRAFLNKPALFSVKAADFPDNIILLPLTLTATLFTLLLCTLDATLLWKILAQKSYFSDR